MESENFVRMIAGTVITSSVLGSWFIHDYLYLITLFAGLNLLQSSLTDFCPPEIIHRKYLSK